MKKNYLKLIILTIITIIITCFCVIDFNPLFNKINKGLDLKGGFEVLYEVNPIDKDGKVTSDMVYQSYKTILKRGNYNMITENDIWNYLRESKWKNSINLTLSEMVQDILHTDNSEFAKYKEKMKENIF